MNAILIRVTGAVALSLGCLPVLAGCADDRAEIRTRCDGPNMIYETWREEVSDDEAQLELRDVQVVPNDPRCAATGPTPVLSPTP